MLKTLGPYMYLLGLVYFSWVLFILFDLSLYEDILNLFPGRACIINSHQFVPLIA